MKDKPNKHPGNCARCGTWVEAGAGSLVRKEYAPGEYGWRVEHAGECPALKPTPAKRSAELPRWAVMTDGITPAGLVSHGIAHVDGDRPDGDAWPVNEAARVEEAKR